MNRKNIFIIFYLIITVILSACAAPKPVMRYVWPLPPDEPKIEYLGMYKSSSDILKDTLLTQFLGKDAANLNLINPQMIASNGNGKVYVTDQKVGGVLIFNFETGAVTTLGGESAKSLFSQPTGVAIDAAGFVYVADSAKGKISVFTPENMPYSIIDLSASVKSIGFIAIDKQRKKIIAPDPKSSKVLVVDFSGKILTTITNLDHKDSNAGFNKPNAAAVASNGDIFVADSIEARVVHFSPDGKYISSFGTRGDTPGQFGIIQGIAIDSEDHIYITDVNNDRFTIMSTKGEFLLSVGSTGNSISHIGVFQLPFGISIDKNDTIFIVEKFWGRFQKYQYMSPAYIAKKPFSSQNIAKPIKEKSKKDIKP